MTFSREELFPRAFRPPIVTPLASLREVADVGFADLIRLLAEGVADAQLSLDRASAEMAVELANTRVPFVQEITETIDEKGNVSFKTGDPIDISLLELGISPTFYQFSEAKVEVAMDVKIVENTNETTKQRRFSLFARTADVTRERKLNRNVNISSRLTATMVPVPSPIRVDPVRRVVTPGE